MRHSNKKHLLIFDFDGVIADTVDICFRFNKSSNPDLSFESYQAFSNGNFHEVVAAHPTFVPSDNFEEIYWRELHQQVSIPDALKDLIQECSEKCHLAIVSSVSEHPIHSFLEQERLAHLFSHILGYETHKSKVVKFTQLKDQYTDVIDTTVFITDTLGDIREANQVTIPTIGVTWGLHPSETLQQGNPHAIVHSHQDLRDVIQQSFGF